MYNIEFDESQNALIFTYEADGYQLLDLMCARLGIGWDKGKRR